MSLMLENCSVTVVDMEWNCWPFLAKPLWKEALHNKMAMEIKKATPFLRVIFSIKALRSGLCKQSQMAAKARAAQALTQLPRDLV